MYVVSIWNCKMHINLKLKKKMVRCAKLWKIQEARLLGTCTAHVPFRFSHLHGYLGLHDYSGVKSIQYKALIQPESKQIFSVLKKKCFHENSCVIRLFIHNSYLEENVKVIKKKRTNGSFH